MCDLKHENNVSNVSDIGYGPQHYRKAIESKKECVTKKVKGGQDLLKANNVKLTEPVKPFNFSFSGNFTSFQSGPISHTKPATTS